MAEDPTTWTELKTTLANWLNRTDATSEIEEAIALAERKFQRELFLPEQESETTLTATAEVLALPADFLAAKDVYLNTDPRTVLEPMPLNDLRNRYSSQTTGKPQNYAIRGESLVFGPAPDASYDVKLAYVAKHLPLSASQTSNALLLDHPDVYIAGALAKANMLFGDMQRAAAYDRECDDIIASINMHTARRKAGGPPIRIRSPVSV